MSHDWDELRAEVVDLYARQNLTLDEISETVNKRHGLSFSNRAYWEKLQQWKIRKVDRKSRHKARGWHKARSSAISVDSGCASLRTDKSTREPTPDPGDCWLNGGECHGRFDTEDSGKVSTLNMVHRCWGRHPAALSAIRETDGSEQPGSMNASEFEEFSGSDSDSALSGRWSTVGTSFVQTSDGADTIDYFEQPHVPFHDTIRRQVHLEFRVSSVDSLLQVFDHEKSHREACGKQCAQRNENLESVRGLLESWKRSSEAEFSAEINFVTQVTAGQNSSMQTPAEVERLLWRIGLCPNLDVKDWAHAEELINYEHLSEAAISQLRSALINRAQHRRLLLVCPQDHVEILEKAVTSGGSKESSEWMSKRMAGLLILGPSIHARLRLDNGRTYQPHYGKSQHPGKFESGKMRGKVSQQTLCSSSSLLVPGPIAQSIHIHTLSSPKQPSSTIEPGSVFAWLPSISDTLKAGRREKNIRCHEEEYRDCLSWSILDLLKKDMASCAATRPNRPLLNDREKLESRSFLSACAMSSTFESKNAARASLILKALRWIAFSFRPLKHDELFAALALKPAASAAKPSDIPEDEVALRTVDELIELCSGLLRADDQGFVEFCDLEVKNLVLQSETSLLDACKPSKIHEMIAMVCMNHLRCLHPQSLFRPWISTNIILTDEPECCRLRSYSTSYWHEHFRSAEVESEYLPSILDEAVQSVICPPGSHHDPVGMFQALRINLGLWICCLHDFARTGKTYLQMGAQVDLQYPLERTPLHIAAANASPDMLKILLDGGADLESSDAEGWNALQHALFSGSCDIVSLLINHQEVASKEHESDPFTSVCQCSTYRDCSQVRTSVHDTAQVAVWSPLEAPSQTLAKATLRTAKSDVPGNTVTDVSAYTSNAQSSLEHKADRSVTLINRECVSKLSATKLPLRSKAAVPPSMDTYQDDWLFINECQPPCGAALVK